MFLTKIFGKLSSKLFATPKSVPACKRKVTAVLVSLCLLLAVSTRPFSLLFPVLHDRAALQAVAADLNAQRTQAALDYFSLSPRKTLPELRALSRPGNNSSSSFRFTIAIITVGRRKPPKSQRDVGYVLQSAASVMSLVRRERAFRNSFVFVCNVDLHPDNHADAVFLRDFLPYVERYGSSTVPNVSRLQIPGTELLYRDVVDHNLYLRELRDYMFCLQAAHRHSSQYYLVLQDDAVPHPDFSDVLEHSLAKLTKPQACLHRNASLLESLLPSSSYTSCLSERPPYLSRPVPQTQRSISPSPNSSFAYIKFFFPERWQGFAFETGRLLDLCSFGAVGGGVGLLFHAVWTYGHGRVFQPGRRPFLLGAAVTLLLSYAVGRQNLNELRRVSKYLYRLQSSPRCCVPAMLYPAPVVPFLITWLADSPRGIYVDLRIADCFEYYEVPGYYIEPNVVHHVGMVTTLPKEDKKPVEEFLLFR